MTDQYGIEVPALSRFQRGLDAICLCRGGGGRKKPKPVYRPPAPAPAYRPPNNTAANAATAAAKAEQDRIAQEQAAVKAEQERIAAETARMAAESATYATAADANNASATAPTGATSSEDPAAAAKRRRRGGRTSILAGETGYNSTLG